MNIHLFNELALQNIKKTLTEVRGALNCKEWMKGNKTMKQL